MARRFGRAWVAILAVLIAVGGLTVFRASDARAEVKDAFDRGVAAGAPPVPAGRIGPGLAPAPAGGAGAPAPAVPPLTATAQAGTPGAPPAPAEEDEEAELEGIEDYDPWEPFNERMFKFNYEVVDRYVLKPAATWWDRLLPDPVQTHLAKAFDNLGMPRRFVNHVLQLNHRGAAGELARFLLNSTIGLAGLFDFAGATGLPPSDADTGQTLGVYGVGPGPYLILPVLPPLTVRDGIGYAADIAMDPLSWLLPLPVNLGKTATRTVNERSLNLEFFQDVEESVLDLYSSVRNGYLQRRRRMIEERKAELRAPKPVEEPVEEENAPRESPVWRR